MTFSLFVALVQIQAPRRIQLDLECVSFLPSAALPPDPFLVTSLPLTVPPVTQSPSSPLQLLTRGLPESPPPDFCLVPVTQPSEWQCRQQQDSKTPAVLLLENKVFTSLAKMTGHWWPIAESKFGFNESL